MVKAYILDWRGVSLPENAMALLPAWRRERAAELRRPAAREESVWTGLLWRWAMEKSGFDPDMPISVLPAGKPVAADGTVFFSLSNSGPLALCAVGNELMGADVQQARPVNLTIARRFHPEEQAWLAAQPEGERELAFFRVWTRKEAWVKAASNEEFLSLSQQNVIKPLQDWGFMDYNVIVKNVSSQYLAALCSQGEALPAALTQIQPEALLTVLGREKEESPL
ncbi:MAG: 4'-phosphopantetheinyl transferase superfamily protein [Oscillospiraceae bacterium]|nr:4'-phosphopantetheinyl transferase superfamily protein [Oscillospiraceae bacterium]